MVPRLTKDEAGILRARIYDLTEQGAKQALFGMVDVLREHPSVLLNAFRLLILDASEYSENRRRAGIIPGVWGG